MLEGSGPMPGDARTIKDAVREAYAGVAKGSGCCCGGAPAGDVTEFGHALGYQAKDIEGVPDGANLGLGCGAPLEYAELRPGETVLDLGSGAGFDCFVARRTVGETGQIIGVDMTPEMVAKARANAQQAGYGNVEFRLGEIEALPVADASVDLVISNCVLNLVPDKSAAFREIARVLKPGGRLVVSDIVRVGELPGKLRDSMAAYAACASGALPRDEYLAGLTEAGLTDIEVLREVEARPLFVSSACCGEIADLEDGVLASATIRARKPGPV